MRRWVRGLAVAVCGAAAVGGNLGCSDNEHREVRVEERTEEGEVREAGQGREMVVD
jgi:hypothetical protein